MGSFNLGLHAAPLRNLIVGRSFRRQARIAFLRVIPLWISATLGLFCALAAAAEALDRHVHPVKDPLSELGRGRFHIMWEMSLLLAGVGGVMTAAGLWWGVRPSLPLRKATVLLTLGSAAISLLSIFRSDSTLRPTTSVGTLHLVLAASGFVMVATSTIHVGRALKLDPHWRQWRHAITWSARIVTSLIWMLLVVAVLEQSIDTYAIGRYTGLIERLAIFGLAWWLVFVSLEMRRVATLPLHVVERQGHVVVQ
jgi:hypothetical protein